MFVFRWSYFVENQALRDAQCVVFAHHKPDYKDQTIDVRKYMIITSRLGVRGNRIGPVFGMEICSENILDKVISQRSRSHKIPPLAVL